MSDTKIEWADMTWNPLLGCERVTSGCDGCYAIITATIRAKNPHPTVASAFAGLTERRDGRLDWTGRINLLPERLNQPLRRKKPQRIFVNSQSDLFHKDVPAEFIARVFAVMAQAPRHTFQLLTKRHGRMRSLLSSSEFQRQVFDAVTGGPRWDGDSAHHDDTAAAWIGDNWPLSNLHLGVSVEDQKTADMRIPALRGTPAIVRWLSMEPLIGPVDLSRFLYYQPIGGADAPLHWIVVGGETGAKSRPMQLEWARNLRDQCTSAGVPFFFKQWGDWVPTSQRPAAHGWDAADRDVPRRLGKKRAGRLLDDRAWDEFPTESAAVVA